jgi:hypothetical protein
MASADARHSQDDLDPAQVERGLLIMLRNPEEYTVTIHSWIMLIKHRPSVLTRELFSPLAWTVCSRLFFPSWWPFEEDAATRHFTACRQEVDCHLQSLVEVLKAYAAIPLPPRLDHWPSIRIAMAERQELCTLLGKAFETLPGPSEAFKPVHIPDSTTPAGNTRAAAAARLKSAQL